MSEKIVEQFFALTPDRILDAVELVQREPKIRATGYALALNSLENRVYECELEDGARLVAKFYRPGRWPRAAILDEHRFLAELHEAEVPVVAPLPLDAAGNTLGDLPVDGVPGGGAIHFAVFEKVRGRAPEDLTDEQLKQLGRLIARLHNIGDAHPAPARPRLDPEYYGAHSLRTLVGADVMSSWVPPELRARFSTAAQAIIDACARRWGELEMIRIHGDCHPANLLWGTHGPFFLDFDDFLHGPPVQDIWLLAPGRDDDADRQRALIVDGYETMRRFDRRSLAFVEPLRALRILRYAAWIATRWRDPAFPRAFPDWEDHRSWHREVGELEEQRARVEAALITSN